MGVINKKSLINALINTTILIIIILLISYFFIENKLVIGPILIFLGLISLIPIFFLKISLKTLKGDILFGIIDNGVLAIFALSGAEFFGILGAIVGGLVGNAITDGLAGVFEGYEWQKIKLSKIKSDRTALTVALGKIAGCLFGGGIILTIIWSVYPLLKIFIYSL